MRVRQSGGVARRRLPALAPAEYGVGLVPALIASAAEPKSRTVSIDAPRGTSESCTRVLPLRHIVAAPAVGRGAFAGSNRGFYEWLQRDGPPALP